MSKRVVLPCAGLATDPNPLITAAQGALQRADDVIIKHPNVASLRPSFPVSLSQATDYRPRAMHVYQGEVVVSSYDSPDYAIETVADVLDTDATPPDPAISPTQFVEARSNLYYTTVGGVRKVTSPTAAATSAGLLEMPSAAPTPSASPGSILPTGYVWAYRACIVREDANGVIVRSAPSPWWTYENASGSGVVATWSIPIAADVVEGDTIELYRSVAVATGSTPPDMLYLSSREAITSTEVTNGWASVADLAADAQLGSELYTNSTREGALRANYPPPAAVVLARYSSCVWYGNTSERQTVGIQIRRVMPAGTSDNTDGVAYAEVGATGSSGASAFTFTGPTVGHLHTGMYVYDAADPFTAGSYFAARTKITSIVGSGISVDKPLIGSPAAATVKASDAVAVGADEFFSVPAASWTQDTYEFPVYVTGDHAHDVGRMAQGLAFNVNLKTGYLAYATEDALTAGSVIIRAADPSAVAFSVSFPTLGTGSAASAIESLAAGRGLDSSALIKPNRIYYSKPDEPEHVPIVNYVSVGAEGAPVYAMARSRDALIVFKSDGIFKVTGSAPDNWRVDEIDSVTRVMRGSCVSEMGGLVYAWTNRGAVAVSELGVQLLSARRISRELDSFAFHMSEEPSTEGCYVTTWPDAGLVLFGVPSGEGSASTSHIYVYSEATSAWSRWVMSTLCAAHDRDAISLYLANADGWRIAVNSVGAVADGTTGYDTSHALSGWTVDGTSIVVTYAEAGDWVPAAGDWVSTLNGDDFEYRRVDAAVDDGVSSYTLTISSAFDGAASSAQTAYEAANPVIEWQPVTGPDAFATNLWREAQVGLVIDDAFVTDAGSLLWTIGASNEHATAAVTKAVTVARSVPPKRRNVLRAGLDREVGRGVECAPYFAGSNLFAPWHCRGVALSFTPDGGDADRSVR